MPTVLAPGFDLSDPDLLADRLPLDEFAYLRARTIRCTGTRRTRASPVTTTAASGR